MKRALIIGITGQDGSYLAELLLSKGYDVHGLIRRSSSFNTGRIEHLYEDPHVQGGARLKLHYGDLTDGGSLAKVLREAMPHEVYNLGAMSHVRVSFDMPEYTGDVVALGTTRLLEALREYEDWKRSPDDDDYVVDDWEAPVRYYQASSSELFGNSPAPQNEDTPFAPRSPYAAAKLYACWMVRNYREAYNLHASNGILFNHESPRRSPTFVSRKITQAAAKIKLGKQDKLFLGNLDAKRDWGFAGDYVEAMWLMLQQDVPADYVIATGRTHTVRQFLDAAFDHPKIDLDWRKYVEVDPRYYRPTEVDELLGDAEKARQMLGWVPKTSFEDLVKMMVEADLEAEGKR